MNARAAIVLTVSSLSLIPFGALAQSTIPYEVGQYEFAQPLELLAFARIYSVASRVEIDL